MFACGIRNLGKFYTLNLESWALEFGIQYKESGIPLTIGIHNPSSTDKDWNPLPGIRNPRYGIQNPRLSWIPLHGPILYRVFSVACPAATQIYWNKRTFLHNKVKLPQDRFVTPTWPPIHCFRTLYGGREVMWRRSIDQWFRRRMGRHQCRLGNTRQWWIRGRGPGARPPPHPPYF